MISTSIRRRSFTSFHILSSSSSCPPPLSRWNREDKDYTYRTSRTTTQLKRRQFSTEVKCTTTSQHNANDGIKKQQDEQQGTTKNEKKKTHILNPETNRWIKIGGPTWNDIMTKRGGYIAHNGKLVPIDLSSLKKGGGGGGGAPHSNRSTNNMNDDNDYQNSHLETLTPTILSITPPSTPSSVIISHLQKNYLFINKPPHLNTVPSRTSNHSLATLLSTTTTTTTTSSSSSYPPKPCHRLDRDTSGIIAFGLNPPSHRHLSLSFQNKDAKKTYVALIAGVLPSSNGSISYPIGKELTAEGYHKWVINGTKKPREARTDYIVDEVFFDGLYSRVVLYPRTGRGHQLRLHVREEASGGGGILGDSLHGRDDGVKNCVPRLCLHAQRLEFELKGEGEGEEWEAIVEVFCEAPF